MCDRFVGRGGAHDLSDGLRRSAAENDNIEQRVASEPVSPMHGDAGRLADGHEAGYDPLWIVLCRVAHLGMIIGRDTAHIIMSCGQHRDRFAWDVDARKDARRLRDARGPLMKKFGLEMR